MANEHFDVLIVGAGISGIGAAHHLQEECPGKTYAILEAREAIGGTWDLFRYPGLRSDSDMHTLGYRFRPWTAAKAIADGPAILDYVRDTARDGRIDEHVRFGHRVVRADWSDADLRWTVTCERPDSGETFELTCDFLFSCGGYYRYDEGYTPEFEGSERFTGPIVHPQHWPEDLDYAGKRVVVIGSGATAVTLVPAMAETAAHVTMLQRSPTYIVSMPGEDPIANFLRRFLPEKATYTVVRWKNVLIQAGFFQLSRRRPRLVKRALRVALERELPADFDFDTHFKPSYNPWDQRICLVPDSDLFKSLSDGTSEVVTDRIETFTETGIKLESGRELDADIIVTATGLNLQMLGGMEVYVDGEQVVASESMVYKGMMLGDVPNLAFWIGYTNASWTLKADLTAEYMCRVLKHMDANGFRRALPRRDPSVAEEPFMDFKSGYVQRSLHELPKQGAERPWRMRMNYPMDILEIRRGSLEDSAMEFSREPRAAAAVPAGAGAGKAAA
jgi:monooxygenase